MHALPDFRDLIIGRIEQSRRLYHEQNALTALAPAPTIEAELQINRGVIRLVAALKRMEKERVETEKVLLEEMGNARFLNTRAIEDVCSSKVRYTRQPQRFSAVSTLPSARRQSSTRPPAIDCATSSSASSRNTNAGRSARKL